MYPGEKSGKTRGYSIPKRIIVDTSIVEPETQGRIVMFTVHQLIEEALSLVEIMLLHVAAIECQNSYILSSSIAAANTKENACSTYLVPRVNIVAQIMHA